MQIKSTRSLNAIPATEISGVFNLFYRIFYVNYIVTNLYFYFLNPCKYFLIHVAKFAFIRIRQDLQQVEACILIAKTRRPG